MGFSQRKKRVYFHNRDKSKKNERDREYYKLNSESINARARPLYASDPHGRKARAGSAYKANPENKNASDRVLTENILTSIRLK